MLCFARRLLSMKQSSKKRVITKNTRVNVRSSKRTDSVKFDYESRREFITGFSKRRSARKEKGKKRAALESREKHLAERHSVRKHMSAELRRVEGNQINEVYIKQAETPIRAVTSYDGAVLNSDSFGNVTVLTTTW